MFRYFLIASMLLKRDMPITRLEIIRQLNQLPIQKQYELHLKNGKTKIVDKLTPLLIGKTQIMHFYETL